jgi:antiviral helicase SKI2
MANVSLNHATSSSPRLIIRQSPITLPLPPLRLTPLPATHNVLPLSKGIEGTFSRWREAIAPKPPAHPALSSSTTRAPGSSKNFVRGKGSYAPFLPGGLDEKEDLAPEEGEEELEEEDGWKTRAPGLKRGVQLSGGKLGFPLSMA